MKQCIFQLMHNRWHWYSFSECFHTISVVMRIFFSCFITKCRNVNVVIIVNAKITIFSIIIGGTGLNPPPPPSTHTRPPPPKFLENLKLLLTNVLQNLMKPAKTESKDPEKYSVLGKFLFQNVSHLAKITKFFVIHISINLLRMNLRDFSSLNLFYSARYSALTCYFISKTFQNVDEFFFFTVM